MTRTRTLRSCPDCEGTGTLYVDPAFEPLDGIGAYDCERCDGTGKIVEDR